MTKSEIYKEKFTEHSWPGLEAINIRKQEIYGDQEPVHWATTIPYELGGKDPLWTVECFKSEKQQKHFHYLTLGFTNLWYDEEFAEDEINGFGFELSFRHLPVKDDPEQPVWASNFLQNIAKYVFKTGNGFDDFHYMSANGPIRVDTDTNITAFAIVTDPELQQIETPHGRVKFLQVFGITTKEYTDIKEKKYSAKELISKHQLINPLLITDLARQ